MKRFGVEKGTKKRVVRKKVEIGMRGQLGLRMLSICEPRIGQQG